jgi:hypothetical protein
MADYGARYEMDDPIFMSRTEFSDGTFKSRLYPNRIGLKRALTAMEADRAFWMRMGSTAGYVVKDYKLYALPRPPWMIVDLAEIESGSGFDEDLIEAEIERIKTLYTDEEGSSCSTTTQTPTYEVPAHE